MKGSGTGEAQAGADRVTFVSRLLAEAERAAQTPAGAKELWINPRTSSAVLDTLKRPASGSAYTQVCRSLHQLRL